MIRQNLYTNCYNLSIGRTIVLSLEEAWIKAAIEHVTLEITYYNKTKNEVTVREVEPDYFGWSRNGRNFGCWGICRLRGDNRCFSPDEVRSWKYIGNEFTANIAGRWQELLPLYNQRGLKSIPFEV